MRLHTSKKDVSDRSPPCEYDGKRGLAATLTLSVTRGARVYASSPVGTLMDWYTGVPGATMTAGGGGGGGGTTTGAGGGGGGHGLELGGGGGGVGAEDALGATGGSAPLKRNAICFGDKPCHNVLNRVNSAASSSVMVSSRAPDACSDKQKAQANEGVSLAKDERTANEALDTHRSQLGSSWCTQHLKHDNSGDRNDHEDAFWNGKRASTNSSLLCIH
jgi:hypothetical protein